MRSYPPYWGLLLHPPPEDAPCCGDRDPISIGEGRGPYRVSVRKPEEKSSLGRYRRRGKDNIKIGLQEVG
jgi:hypothetical protein